MNPTENGHVLFIVHDVYQTDNHFPLGIGYMAAILRENGVDVEIYSQDIFHYSNEELGIFLRKKDFDLIGVGFLGARFNETILNLCNIINKEKKTAWLVLGGHGPTPISEYILKQTNVEIVVLGEAENTILDLLKCKINNGDLSTLNGIAYRKGEVIRKNQRGDPIKNLDSIPFPEWSLFPMKSYATCLNLYRMEKGDRVLDITTSRGCTNRCNFCYRMEKGIRLRSIENVITEMKILNEKYAINYFLINDEMFISSPHRIFEFRDALEENNLKIKFSCAARVDIFDEEIAKCLKDCGCQFLNFGMESMNQNVLNLMKKHTTIEQNILAAEITKKFGIGIGLNFIFGNRGDTERTLKDNVEAIKKFNSYDQLRTIRPVTPYPGSDLYYEAIRDGLLSGPNDFFIKFLNSDLLTVNFTDIPNDKFYKMLFDANKELIKDHFKNTTKDMKVAEEITTQFHELYFGNRISFRGSRHY